MFLGKPDFEHMLETNMPLLVHHAIAAKEPASRREAIKIVSRDMLKLVQYLYETVVWAHENSYRADKLPKVAVRRLDDASLLFRQLGAKAIDPLATSLRVYDEYGDPDEAVSILYFVVVLDILEKMGAPAVNRLCELTHATDTKLSQMAQEALGRLADRGLSERTAPARRHNPRRR